jgi:hypothetical protein
VVGGAHATRVPYSAPSRNTRDDPRRSECLWTPGVPRGAHGTAREARALPMHAALHPIRPVNSESWYLPVAQATGSRLKTESAPEVAVGVGLFPADPPGRVRSFGGSGGSRHRLISIHPPGEKTG